MVGAKAGAAIAGSASIGTLNERPLHASLKTWYAREGDRFEERVGGFVIDIVRPVAGSPDLLIEIQTRHLYALKRKLSVLVESHPVRLVHPIPARKWIVRMGEDGAVLGRRRSPRRGSPVLLFAELVRLPRLIEHPSFSLEILLTEEEEVRVRDDSLNWRRRGWATAERRLLGVLESHVFEQPADLMRLLPADVEDPFTPAELADALAQPAWLARRMVYCLRETGLLVAAGKRGRSNLFARESRR